MFEELSIYLEQTVSPQRQDLIRDALECLSKTEDRSYEDRLQELLDVSDQMGDTITTASFEVLLREYISYSLNNYAIKVTEEDINLTVPLFKAVQAIEDFEDPTQVIAICDEESSPEMILAHLVELITDIHWTEMLPLIEEVSPSLIDRIQDLASGKEDMFEIKAEEYQFDVTPYVVRLRRFTKVFPDNVTLISKLLEEGFEVGREMDEYLDEIAEDIDGFSPRDTALEFVAIALASKVEFDDIEQTVAVKIEELFDNWDLLLRAKNELPKIMIGVKDA